MRGRKPSEYNLSANDRRYLTEIVKDRQLIQRVANRARVLLALDRGERVVEILRWTGLTRMAVWYLWQRYLERGVEALFDGERSGRPAVFPLHPASSNRAHRLHRPGGLWPAFDAVGLSHASTSHHRAGNR